MEELDSMMPVGDIPLAEVFLCTAVLMDVSTFRAVWHQNFMKILKLDARYYVFIKVKF